MKRIVPVCFGVLLAASLAFGQARILSLGGNTYINDPSRLFTNPAKAGEYKDMLYGESGSRIFGTIGLTDALTLGVAAPRSLAHTFSYNRSAVGAPGADNLHFLLGLGNLGFEVWSEGESTVLDSAMLGSPAIDHSSSIRSIDVKAGLSFAALDLSVGLGYIMESDLSASVPDSAIETSGTGLGGLADMSILFGSNTRLGIYSRLGAEIFQEERIATPRVGTTVTVKNPDYQAVEARAGFLGEIQIADPAKFFLLAGVGAIRTAMETDATPKTANIMMSYILPELRAGFEYEFGRVWKIENVFLRAGASKVTYTQTDTTIEITYPNVGKSIIERRSATIPGTTTWTLGTGIRQGAFALDATVAPGSLDGVYFLNGGGPNLASITLSYKFRGGSSSSSSESSSYTPSNESRMPASGDEAMGTGATSISR